jgi:hypothetical protein
MKPAYLCGPPDKKTAVDLSKGVVRLEIRQKFFKNKLGGKGKCCIFAARL